MNSPMNRAWAGALAKRLECVRFTGAFPWTADRRTSKSGAQAHAFQTLARSDGVPPEQDAGCADSSARRSRRPAFARAPAASPYRPTARLMYLALSIAAWAWPVSAQPAAIPQNLIVGDLRVGFAKQAFAGANRNDLEAAFKAFLVTAGRRRGFDLQARAQVFDDGPDFEAAIRDGLVQLAIIPSWDYLTMNLRDFADPCFVAEDQQGILEEYLVLTRKDAGFRSMADLRGKNIAVLESVNTYLSWHWLETLLLQHELGSPGKYFGRIEKVAKASSAVLPVFFGTFQACVVDRAAFDIMRELNPQIGQRLQILLISPPLLDAVVCLSKSGWIGPEHKEAASLGLAELDTEPAGQQILTLFKSRKIVPFKPEYLESIRQLKAEHDRLARAAQTGADAFKEPFGQRRDLP